MEKYVQRVLKYVVTGISIWVNNSNLQEKGTVIVSMDALFGLPRKKAAGSSHKAPLNQGMYFLSQQDVDDFVNKQVTFPNQFQNNVM